jgi:hypothetical protein
MPDSQIGRQVILTSPPEMMISLLLSMIDIEPSGYITARSPELKLPPRKAVRVASGSRKYWGSQNVSCTKRDQASVETNLLHDDISSHDNLTHCLAVSRDIHQFIRVSIGLENDTSLLRGCEAVTLMRHELCAFRKGHCGPRGLIVASRERAVGLER